MAEIRATKVEQGQTKIKNVPIAVTPEGFWCCPSPVMFQKTPKAHNSLNKPKSSPSVVKNYVENKPTLEPEQKPATNMSRLELVSNDHSKLGSDTPVVSTPVITESTPCSKIENLPRKVSIEFGEPGTSDFKVVLLGKQGFVVELSVHRRVLVENSSFFGEKFIEEQPDLRCLEINDCEDVEIYVETVGLMYCKEIKQRLIKQSISRVLRILKVAEQLHFSFCIQSCLEYLEAVPWVGEEEEEKVVTSVLHLNGEGISVNPVLKRVSSGISKPHKDTISCILELVLKSNEEKGRREMKNIVLKLLKENNNLPSCSSQVDLCTEAIYTSCRICLDTLLSLFRNVTEPDFTDKKMDIKSSVVKQLALQADNLTWLLDILADSRAADDFAVMWANQQELAALHARIPIVSRHHISCISGRMFVGIGRGELLPSKDTRHLLLQTWLQPLINDYSWLQRGCKSFDRKAVEEGIGRTILTLPLEDQQSILLSWLGSFLKSGDNCPNLQRAFEIWWRRSFIRPHAEPGNHFHPGSSLTQLLDLE